MKKQLFSFFIVAILTASIVPVSNLISGFSRDTTFDDFSVKKLYSLDPVIGEVNYFFKKLGFSIDNNVVVTGKDDFLFLGNNYDRVTDLHRGFINKDDEIENTVSELLRKQKFFDELSIDNIFIIAPDKYTAYPDKLPNWLTVPNKLPADYFMDKARENGLNALYLKDYLINADLLSYYKTDTHWNNYGAYLGYKASIDYLNNVYDRNIEQIGSLSFKFLEREGGDLSRFMKYSHHIIDYKASSSDLRPIITKCQYDLDDYGLTDCEDKENSDTATNNKSFYTKNNSALNDKKLLFLKDSFGTANSTYYQRTFKETIQAHYNNLQGNEFYKLVKHEKPDIIIYQAVERGFSNAGYARAWDEHIVPTAYINGKKTIDKSLLSSHFNEFMTVDSVSTIKVKLSTRAPDPFFLLNLSDIKCGFDTLNIVLESSVSGNAQVFYNTNDSESYNPRNSTFVRIEEGQNKFSLSFSDDVVRNELRFDLPDVGGNFVFSHFEFLTDKEKLLAKECR